MAVRWKWWPCHLMVSSCQQSTMQWWKVRACVRKELLCHDSGLDVWPFLFQEVCHTDAKPRVYYFYSHVLPKRDAVCDEQQCTLLSKGLKTDMFLALRTTHLLISSLSMSRKRVIKMASMCLSPFMLRTRSTIMNSCLCLVGIEM